MIQIAADTDVDVCPMCLSTLGAPRGATRRQIVFCETPGVFRWRCPDCRGVWQVRTAGSADRGGVPAPGSSDDSGAHRAAHRPAAAQVAGS